jgi:methylenetetrahydrofolate reductase (NADPH)
MLDLTQHGAEEIVDHALVRSIMRLAREASVEINVQDVPYLTESRTLLAHATKIYVSHLPKQRWSDSVRACAAVRAAGFDPIPHIPVRLIAGHTELEVLLRELIDSAMVQEVLLVAGDYADAIGPYSSVVQLLEDGMLMRLGMQSVTLAGHPEGHPKVELATIRNAERQKTLAAAGLDTTLLTQFFFEHEPFLKWADDLHAHGVRARVVAGLAGPASVATLFRFALRCGVGPSVRALGARPASLMKLAGEHGPEKVLRELAEERCKPTANFDGIHLFCFGGYLRTCRWLHAVANGRFRLTSAKGLEVLSENI